MGRRAQANARTLNWAIRQVFKPVISDVPSTRANDVQENEIPIDVDLIPTQPPDQPSEKSLGKRKLVELEVDSDDAGSQGAALQHVNTRYSKSTLPPALKKCKAKRFARCPDYYLNHATDWQQRYRLFSKYDDGIQMDYDGEYACYGSVMHIDI